MESIAEENSVQIQFIKCFCVVFEKCIQRKKIVDQIYCKTQ